MESLVAVAPAASVAVYNRKVMIAMPWQKQVSPITAFCVGQLIDRRRTTAVLNFGDAFVAHSRNSIADTFLASECEYLLTIDDDMVVPFGSAAWYAANTGFNFAEKFMGLNALDRLMSHRKSLVGGLYFGKYKHGPAVYNEGSSEPEYARAAPHDCIKPTRWVGTGCMLTHRTVFEAIEKKFPRLARLGAKGGQWYTSTEASLMDRIERVRDRLTDGTPLDGRAAYAALDGVSAALAAVSQENTLGSGEDVSFCLRAAASGHQPYVDMGLVCGHIGHCVYGPQNTSEKPRG